MLRRAALPFLLLLGFGLPLNAQMWTGADTLYGNEWIAYDQPHFAVKVADDGIYRISYEVLTEAGFPMSPGNADKIRLFRNGREIPLFVSQAGTIGPYGFLEFYGEKNRTEVDRFLFNNPQDENLNERYSLINDTSVYYLTLRDTGIPLRIQAAANVPDSGLAPEPFLWVREEKVFSNGHYKKRISNEITFSWYDGNGFSQRSANSLVSFVPDAPYPGKDLTLGFRYACTLGNHLQQAYIQDSLVQTDEFSGSGILQHVLPVRYDQLKNGKLDFRLQSPFGNADRHYLAWVELLFARTPVFSGQSEVAFGLSPGNAARRITLAGVDTAGSPVLYDLRGGYRLAPVWEGSAAAFYVNPQSADTSVWWYAAGASIRNVSRMEKQEMVDLRQLTANYLILSHPAFLQAPQDPVAEYAAYRRSAAGGGYQVETINVEDLYAQFSYGIRFHPIAIRNFCHFLKQAGIAPEYLFIIGKGLDYTAFRSSAAQSALADSLFFVPVYSNPGADLPYVMSPNAISHPLFPVGRLAVTRPSDIGYYLDKVRRHEVQVSSLPQTLADKAWMKRVLHLSGGIGGETQFIRDYAANMAATLASNRFGADVRTFFKTSTDPVQFSAYQQILDLVNGGVSLWMIYGHSSSNAVDFDIGTASVYQNKDRYPVMMVMGCFSGLCSREQPGLGEDFVLARDRGAIAYFASVNYSFIDALHQFGNTFYEQIGGADYGKSIGKAMTNAIGRLEQSNYTALQAILHQNLLQGDPAIRLHTHGGPDYLPDPATVSFAPDPVPLEQNSFTMQFDVVNLGENRGDSLVVRLEQSADGQARRLLRSDTVAAPAFRRTLTYQLPVSGSRPGPNRIFLSLDPESLLPESGPGAEFNNTLTDAQMQEGVELFFFSDDVSPLFPGRYGIVSDSFFALYAAALNLHADEKRYLMEMDTAYDFSSPLKKSTALSARGGALLWQPDMPRIDSAVYYWRVARDTLIDGQVNWRTSSFVLLPGSKSGWSQSHFGQLGENELFNLELPADSRRLAFRDNSVDMIVNVAWRSRNQYLGLQNSYYEGFTGDYGWNVDGITRGIALMLLDARSGRVIPNPAGGPHSHHPTEDRSFFWFDTRDSLERIRLMDFLQNEVADGTAVGLLAINRLTDPVGYAPHLWAADSVSYGKNLFQVLEMQGAREVRQLANFPSAPLPYGLAFCKNLSPESSRDTTVAGPDALVSIRKSFEAKWPSGYLRSALVGPALRWDSLYWAADAPDNPNEMRAVEVLSVGASGQDSLLFSFSEPGAYSLNGLNDTDIRYLLLRYQTGDTLERTPSHLPYWRVLYEPWPEGNIAPYVNGAFYADTLQEGEEVSCRLSFVNASDRPFDSLLVRFEFAGANGYRADISRRFSGLAPRDTLTFGLEQPSVGMSGAMRMTVRVNPDDDQPEQLHFNNVWTRPFWVASDRANPLLDVTFDGVHIMDRDLVSASPLIAIQLKDENPFLPLTDTSLFRIMLEDAEGQVRPVWFADPGMAFFPAAGSGGNTARIEWQPRFDRDGEYRLQVNGRDASGNSAGNLDFSIRFRVITRSALSHLLNYPNPFSTRTCFVYTLTGAESPAHFRIQIMTVSGKVVREITEAEFGPLLPGRHVSSFCWDGRDQYGDQLANGVYLYRVRAYKADGSPFEWLEEDATNPYFKNGLGKMVLMR